MTKRQRDDELDVPPLANTIFAGDEAARRLAQQGIPGPSHAIALARSLRAQGASRAEIHARTSDMLKGTPYAGVHFEASGQPRFEITDHNAKLKVGALSKGPAYLGDVLDHPELFKAVPGSSMATVTVGQGDHHGAYTPGANEIEIGERHTVKFGKSTALKPSARGPLLHEIQHVVQDLHNMEGGSSPEAFRKLYPTESREDKLRRETAYKLTAGEQEAEATRKRQALTPDERRTRPATEDMMPIKSHRRPPVEVERQNFIGDLADVAIDAWKRATTREIVEVRPIHQRRLDPRKVAADPEAFQFKSGGDAAGVTDRLKGVTQWDQLAAGKQVVYQRANGEYVIADGHQRRGLALRAIEGGQKDVALDAFVLREKDGWSTRDVRAYAALKNMKESSGNALDMAKVMRERPDLVGKSLPMSDAKIRDAVALSRLSDKAFDMVASGVVKPEHAAPVGAQVKETTRHADMLTEMVKAGMRSAEHARLYVSQALAAPSISETTGSLFGDETQVRSLLAERAKVLDRALSQLKGDKRIFAMLEREAANIEAAGNRLAHSSNLERSDTAGRLAEIVERLSTTRGPVSEMLDKAALAMAEGKAPTQAARGFVTDVSKAMKADGINGLMGTPASMAPAIDANPGAMFGDGAHQNPGWSDEARAASAKSRKGKGRGRKQMMIEDGRPAPSKDMVASVAKDQNLKRADKAATYADGWKAAKDGRRLASGVDPDFAAGYRQYLSDKSPRAAERAMVEYLAGGDAPVSKEVSLAGKTKGNGQGSFLPDATTKEQIAAAAKAKGRPSASQLPMDDGMFGSGVNQTDLVDAIKQKQNLPVSARIDTFVQDVMSAARSASVGGMRDLKYIGDTYDQFVKNTGSDMTLDQFKQRIIAEKNAGRISVGAGNYAGRDNAILMEQGRSVVRSGADDFSLIDVSKQNLPPPPQIDRKPSSWVESLPKSQRQNVFKSMRAIDAEAQKAYNIENRRSGIEVGSADFDRTIKGAAYESFLREIRKGASPDAAASAASAEVRKIVETHNGRRTGDINWARDANFGQQYVEAAKMAVSTATDIAPKSKKTGRVAGMSAENPWPSSMTTPAPRVADRHAAALTQTENQPNGQRPGWSDAAREASAQVRTANSKPLKQMTVKELRAKAKADGISISGATTKAQIQARIQRGKPSIFGSDNKYPVSAKSAAPFDPYSAGLVPIAQREGPAGLAKVIGGMTAEQARATAKSQGIHVPAAIKSDAAVREYVARGVFKQMANKRAAAGGDPSKYDAMADEVGNHLRGTQNEANREAIAKNRKAKAKAKAARDVAGQKQAFENADRASRNRMTQFSNVQNSGNPLTPAERTKLADKRPEYDFMRPKDSHQAALTQTENQPAAKPAKTKGRVGKVAGFALGPVALGAGLAAAAILAANKSAEAGQSTTKQAASATVAAAHAAAPVAVIGGGLAAAVKVGALTAGRAALVGTGLGAVAIGASAYAYGAQAAKEGKGAGAITKAAMWGAINGVVPVDAIREAVHSTRARVAGAPTRPTEQQMGQFVQANDAYQRQQAMNTIQADQSDRKPGWSPEARIASAKSRGVDLPYGGNPAAAPGYIPPKTHNGKAA